MDFPSPLDGSGTWNLDEEYEGYEWWLGLTDEGKWEIVSYGYN